MIFSIFRAWRGLLVWIGLLTGGVAVSAFAQGTLQFNNRVPEVGLDAPILSFPGTGASGDDYLAQLYAGVSASDLLAVGEPLPFLTGDDAGYLDTSLGAERVVPTVLPGELATVQVRAWATSLGATFEEANRNFGFVGISDPIEVVTGGDGLPPAYLVGLTSFGLNTPTAVPEPAPYLVFGLGLLFWLARRSMSPPSATFHTIQRS